VAATGSEYAPRLAFERTASAIASARRAVLADRYATDAFAVEWRELAALEPIADEWRELAARALEPNVFYEPAFALAAAPVFGRGTGAVLVWSGTAPRKLLGFFPARIVRRRYGLKLPVLVGWTHPYAPLGTPLVERDAAEPVIAAWLAHLAENPSLPGLLLLPLIAEDGPFAAMLNAMLRRAQMPAADFARHRRALLEPHDNRLDYLEDALSTHRLRELRRSGRRLADLGALLFTTATEPPAVAKAIEDFLALEASGWKGTAGTAAARHGNISGFMAAAVRVLAAEGKATVDRISLDGCVIAAAITLRSAGAAWYWKTAYDETFARYAPGILLTMALTERLAEDETIARTDSCSAPNNPIMDEFWRERLPLADRLIALRPDAPFASVRRLEMLRASAIAGIKTIRKRFLRHR
jgi:CelD/BcsL family acetyltransferase involved in cellulose biosynthesis